MKYFKIKILVLTVVGFCMSIGSFPIFAEGNTFVDMNHDVKVMFNDTVLQEGVITYMGRSYLPLETLAEILELDVTTSTYDNNVMYNMERSNTIRRTQEKRNQTIKFLSSKILSEDYRPFPAKIEDHIVIINNTRLYDTVFSINGGVLLPLASVLNKLGIYYTWNEKDKQISIYKGFRTFPWWGIKSQVAALENLPLERSTWDTLIYDSTIEGIPSKVIYKFTDEKLTQGSYIMYQNFNLTNNQLNHYKNLKNYLIMKYGIPISDQALWDSANDKNSSLADDMAMAIGTDKVKLVSRWTNDNIKISLGVEGNNNGIITISLIYSTDDTDKGQ